MIPLHGRPAPTLVRTLAALRGSDDPEALDLLALTEWVTTAHVGGDRERPDGTHGTCRECAAPWPCPSWLEVQGLTLHWLVAASDAALRRAREGLGA